MMEKREYGYAAAAAVILFFCVMIFTLIQLAIKSGMKKRGLN
jgi:multiple sugar transport system permease protein